MSSNSRHINTFMRHKINSIDSLENEIRLLQARARTLEEKLDDNLDYLQNNYPSMVMNSVSGRRNPGSDGGFKTSIIATITSLVLGNEKLQEAVSRLLQQLLNKVVAGVEKVADHFSRRND